MTTDEINDLAVQVSLSCKWDGNTIMAVMLEALTDANFHTLRSRLELVHNQYRKEEVF